MKNPRPGTLIRLKGNRLNLDTLLPEPQKEGAEAVLYQEFEAEGDGFAQLGIGCDWWFEVYCNGELCYSTMERGNESERYVPYDHPFFFPVRKGKNLLAVRVKRGSLSWKFACSTIDFTLPELPIVTVGPWLGDPDSDCVCIRFTTLGKVGAGIEYRELGKTESQIEWDHRQGRILRWRQENPMNIGSFCLIRAIPHVAYILPEMHGTNSKFQKQVCLSSASFILPICSTPL